MLKLLNKTKKCKYIIKTISIEQLKGNKSTQLRKDYQFEFQANNEITHIDDELTILFKARYQQAQSSLKIS